MREVVAVAEAVATIVVIVIAIASKVCSMDRRTALMNTSIASAFMADRQSVAAIILQITVNASLPFQRCQEVMVIHFMTVCWTSAIRMSVRLVTILKVSIHQLLHRLRHHPH